MSLQDAGRRKRNVHLGEKGTASKTTNNATTIAATASPSVVDKSNYIDMVLNPERATQYRIDVAKAEKDIRAEQQ